MRCPSCGAQNPDHAITCAECGATLRPEVTDTEVDELVESLPTVAAHRAAQEETRRIEEETRLMAELEATRLAETSSDLDEPAFDDEEPAEPAPAQVDPTVIRRRPDARTLPSTDESHFVVRNTRDYDHDSTANDQVNSTGKFATISEGNTRDDTRRDPYARSAKRGLVPGEGNSRSRLRPLLAVFLVALVLGGGGAVLTYGMELWGGKSVPYVVGSSQANAEERLAEKGLVAKIEAEPADDAIGKVLSQDPESGTRVEEGSEVTIVIAANRTIPEVVGLSEDEARAVLEAAGAERVEAVTRPSGQQEGTVTAVSPEQGSAFVSRNTITLTVAGPYTVPDVVGKKETDATDAIKAAGLSPNVTYVDSDKTARTVVETSPAAGDTIAEGGTVEVKVSSPYPSDPLHLAEFFRHSSQDVDAYLQKNDFAFDGGIMDTLGNAIGVYKSSLQGTITFSSQPYARSLTLPKEGQSNVLSTGAPMAGVRLDVAKGQVSSGYKRSSVEELMKLCGLENLDGTCDNDTIKVPAGTKKINAKFVCGSGMMDDLAWTVLIVGNDSGRRASVTVAKRNLYNDADLAPFGGSVRQFVAYQEVFLSEEYQVQEKKDDKKDEKDKDKKGSDSDSDKKDDDSDSDKKDDGSGEQDEGGDGNADGTESEQE